MNSEKISIIMPAYNTEAYIPRSIQSLQKQTHTNWELLIVDDGSSDQTREVVKTFSEQDDRVKLLCNQHGGTAKARNAALEIATGEYIAFIDSDDAYHPLFIEKLLEAIHRDKSDLATCEITKGTDYEGFLQTPLQTGSVCIHRDAAFSRMYNGEWPLFITPCNKLYKAEQFKELRFPEGQYFEDASTTNLALYQCENVSILDASMYFYNITPGSSSKTKRSVELLDREKALRSHWEFFLKEGKKNLAYLAIPFYLQELLMIHSKIRESDRPEDCAIIRKRFLSTYRKYRRKIKITKERREQFFDFRHPFLGTVRYLIRQDGILKTAKRFIQKRLGFRK